MITAEKLIQGLKEAKMWMDNYTKPAGQLDDKYGVMIFKAKYGNYSIVKKIVNDYVRKSKKLDRDIIVMEDMDDNLVKTWVVGNKNKIGQMVNDEFNKMN